MYKNSSLIKLIKNPISISLANEEFFNYSNNLKNLFFHLAIITLILQSIAQPIVFTVPSGFNFNFSEKHSPSSHQNNPHSPLNASSLFGGKTSFYLEDDSRQGLRSSFHELSNPFSLKSAVKADFLTLEPIITALKSTANSSTKSEGFSTTITLASSANASTQIFEKLINNLTASIGAGTNKSNSDSSNTTYTNTIITANNGNLKINSGNDTTIKGANLLAQNTTINTQNNLIIESLQNSSHSKSKSSSMNLGAGSGSKANGGGLGSISLGYNSSRSSFDRTWVDDQTTVIGTNSITINTKNNTHLKGAVIANATNANETSNKSEWIDGGNLTMNTGSLTTENIYDQEKQKSSGFGIQLSNLSRGSSTTVASDSTPANPIQQTNYFPAGSTTLSMQNQGYIKEQTTKATIGNGIITIGSTQTFDANGNLVSSVGGKTIEEITQNPLTTNDLQLTTLNRDINKSQVITKDTITGALDVSVTLDNRLFTSAGRGQMGSEFVNQGGNLRVANKELIKLADAPLVAAATSNVPVLKDVANKIAGNGGSVATLASQLFGLNYLLDSGNSQYNKNTITGLNNNELKTAIQNKDKFEVKKDQNGNEFIVITDKQGNTKFYDYEISKKSLSDVNLYDLTTNKDYGLHGVYNNADEAFRNQLMQLGTLQNYDAKTDQSSFVSLSAPTKGLITDGIENAYNFFFGKTPLASANIQELKDFSQNLSAAATLNGTNLTTYNPNTNQFENNTINISDIRMAAHSNGGDRLYLGVLGGASKGELSNIPNLQVQFYGTPSNTNKIQTAAENAGLKNYDKIQNIINPGDYVGENLGWGNSPDMVNKIMGPFGPALVVNAPKLFLESSPHSNYYCQGSFCQFDKYK